MKLDIAIPNIESSDTFQSSMLSIGDPALILDIIRNKMYSNPIQAVCREISCNSQDAHAEVGTPEIPVRITLPNSLDPNLRIKDFGPGISPNRVEDIYIKYGCSSKREDNTQKGAFGIGSKSILSVTDSFTIITTHNHIKYQYSCYIDETRIGKLSLLSREPTDDPNGTEIVIPAKSQDFKSFETNIEFVTRHWKVRPIVTGSTSFKYEEINPIIKGDNWAIVKSNGYSNRDVKLIIDGIEYPIDIYAIKESSNVKILDAIYGIIYLYFETGSLTLSASREHVHLDAKTKEKIISRLKDVATEVNKTINNHINSLPNLWDANCYVNNDLNKTFVNIKSLGKLEYNGIPITNNHINFDGKAKVICFGKGGYIKRSYDKNKISKSTTSTINFSLNSALYINDLNIINPSVKNVNQAFEDDPNLKTLWLVQPYEGSSTTNEEIINDHLINYNINKLSTITKARKLLNKPSRERLLIFKFDKDFNSFRQIAHKSMDEDTNKKIICSLSHNKHNYGKNKRNVFIKNKEISIDIVNSLLTLSNDVSIYGVDNSLPANKLKDNFEEFVLIDDFIEELLKNNKIDYLKLKYATNNGYGIDHSIVLDFAKIKSSIKDNNSMFLKKAELHYDLNKIITDYGKYMPIYEAINGQISDKDYELFFNKNKHLSINDIEEKVNKTYPLLVYMDRWGKKDNLDAVIQYINLVDADIENNLKNNLKRAI